MQSRAVVVGAGLSGLSAGFHLREAGWEALVLESSDRPGGRARTVEREGFVIDVGPDAVSASYTLYQSLAAKLGIGGSIVPSSPVVGMIRGERLIDIDAGNPLRALFTPALSLAAKVRLAHGFWAMRREIRGTDAFALFAQAEDDDPATSAHDVAKRAFGAEVETYLIDALVRLTTGVRSRDASSLAVRGVLSAWSAPMISVVGGLQALPTRMAETLNVQYGARAERVEQDAGGVAVHWRAANGVLQTQRFDAAVLATQLDAAVEVAPDIAAAIGHLEPKIPTLSLMSVSVAFNRSSTSRAYTVLVPSAEREDELLMFLQHNKAPDRAPPGKSLITFYIEHRSAARWFAMGDDQITRRAIAFITGLMPELAGSFRFCHITRWPRAGSLANPGYYRVVAEIMRHLHPDSPIQVAGDFSSAGSMETALRTGRAAAVRLIERAARSNGATRAAHGA